MKKKILQTAMLIVSLLLNVWGILSLLYVNGLCDIGFLGYYDGLRLIVKYVIIVVIMACGIELFSAFATTFKGKLKNGLSIGCCAYSTVLTIPLFLTFVGCFFIKHGIELPMVGDIARDLMDIFKGDALQYTIFTLGMLLGIIFLAVPIIMTYMTVKGKKLSFKRKKS